MDDLIERSRSWEKRELWQRCVAPTQSRGVVQTHASSRFSCALIEQSFVSSLGMNQLLERFQKLDAIALSTYTNLLTDSSNSREADLFTCYEATMLVGLFL